MAEPDIIEDVDKEHTACSAICIEPPAEEKTVGIEEYACPCDEHIVKARVIFCKECRTWWHINCVALNGISESAARKLSEWRCPRCFVFKSVIADKIEKPGDESDISKAVKREVHGMIPTIIDAVSKSVKESIQTNEIEKVVGEVNEKVGKSWAELAQGNHKQLITDVVKLTSNEALTESMQLIDANLQEQKKRSLNIIVSGMKETGKNPSKEELSATFFKLMDGEIEKKDIVLAKRLGVFTDGKRRNVMITLRYQGDAEFVHNHERGRKIIVSESHQLQDQIGDEIWMNADLTKLQREANYNMRVEKRKKAAEAREAANKPGASVPENPKNDS